MNPRHRRLLIPGLLLALLAVVMFAALTDRGNALTTRSDEPVLLSRMSDPLISESSGLAYSAEHDDVIYTINDSGNDPLVFAVQASTGTTIGVTRVTGVPWRDPEALALYDGQLWIADTGDNALVRDELSVVAIAEPGPGDHQVLGEQFRVRLPDGPRDIEALLVQPRTGEMFLVAKSLMGAEVYSLGVLTETGAEYQAEHVGTVNLSAVTDGSFSPSGDTVVLLSYLGGYVVDPVHWTVQDAFGLPRLQQAESLAFRSEDAVLIGSEGADSPVYSVPLPVAGDSDASVPQASPAAAAPDSPTPAALSVDSGNDTVGKSVAVGLCVVVLSLVFGRVLRARRTSARSNRG